MYTKETVTITVTPDHGKPFTRQVNLDNWMDRHLINVYKRSAKVTITRSLT